jgi:hypothetical protein
MGTCSQKVSGGPDGCHDDDGYIKGKLRVVVLQVLPELKRVLKEDAVMELNVSSYMMSRLLFKV